MSNYLPAIPRRIIVAERNPDVALAVYNALKKFEYMPENIQAMRAQHPDTVAFCMFAEPVELYSDVRDVQRYGAAFISPANSLVFMDGGIDLVYSREMFPGVEAEARRAVHALGLKTKLGRPYLPVGSAITVPIPSDQACLIVAPTMFLPHDVSQTKNAFYAFMAALCAFGKYVAMTGNGHIDTLVTPGLCAGYGKMSPDEVARQMAEALSSYLRGRFMPQMTDAPGLNDPMSYVTPSRDDEQPSNYDNREIKDIPIENLLKPYQRVN